MYDLHLSTEQIEFRDTVRDFVEKSIKPAALHPDRLQGSGPRVLSGPLAEASHMGLRTLALSEASGGAGADNLTSCIVLEELAAGDAGIAVTLAQTAMLARRLFDEMMAPAQRDRFLPRFMADDSYHLAYAPHAREVDTEWCYHRPSIVETAVKASAARQSNGDWVINGTAELVGNAPLAKLLAVQAQSETRPTGTIGVVTLLVPHDSAGLTVRDSEAEPAWYHGTRGTLVFKDCRVTANNLLQGKPTADLRSGSIAVATPQWNAINLGVGRAAHEAALEYSKLRVQGGRRIIEHEGVGMMLADMAVRLAAARNLIWQAAWAEDHLDAYADRSLPDLPLPLLTDAFVSETVFDVAVKASEVFGAMGILKDMPLHKYVHDAQIFLHAGSGNSAAKLRVAEALADYHRPSIATNAQ